MKDLTEYFTPEMIARIREGTKTQARTVVPPPKFAVCGKSSYPDDIRDMIATNVWVLWMTQHNPVGQAGDVIQIDGMEIEITGVRIERLQDINLLEIEAEATPHNPAEQMSYRNDYHQRLKDFKWCWNERFPDDPWEANPWTLVLNFKKRGEHVDNANRQDPN